MQTLEPGRAQVPADLPSPAAEPSRRAGRTAGFAAGVVALVVLAAAVAYGVGASGNHTTTVVKTVSEPARPAAAAAKSGCIPGAAPGSCNIDEFNEQIPDKPLDAATRALLAQQLVTAREAAARYPTVADAVRANLLQAGKFSPGVGAHYIDIGAVNGFDPARPGAYIYDGTSPTSKVVGLMYLSSTVNPPEGFAGPNDHWHRHTNTCVIFGAKITVPFPADSDVTKAMCDNVGGYFMRRTTWMVHAWVVPGWESPLGVFSHNNPDVVCADGTTKTDADGFCAGT